MAGFEKELDQSRAVYDINIPDGLDRLIAVESDGLEADTSLILEALRRDSVVLVRHCDANRADKLIRQVAAGLGVIDSLELQAGFAGFLGHRHNMSTYFMSVNRREDYQFVSPHSEGDSAVGMQLASFFCYENSTNGGQTILMNVDDKSEVWESLREIVTKVAPGSRSLTPREFARVKALYRLRSPTCTVEEDDRIFQERRTEIPGLTLADVFAKPKKSRSCILDRQLNVYWDTIASIDFDSLNEYVRFLKERNLLREPVGGMKLDQMDNAAPRRLWSSGVNYSKLFKCQMTLTLAPGDFLIQNNLTWTHAATNWAPESGTRLLSAAFA